MLPHAFRLSILEMAMVRWPRISGIVVGRFTRAALPAYLSPWHQVVVMLFWHLGVTVRDFPPRRKSFFSDQARLEGKGS